MKPRNKSFRERNTKRQTRLSFQTLPSSSPTKDDDNSSVVKDRLASDRLGTTTPKRLTRSTAAAMVAGLPTPEPSSQPQNAQLPATLPGAESDQDEDEIIPPSSKRRKTSLVEEEDETPTRRSSRLRAGNGSARRRSNALPSSPPRFALDDLGSAETSGDDEIAIISKPTRRRRKPANSSACADADADDPFVVPYDDPDSVSKSRRRRDDDFVVDDDEVEYVHSQEEDTRPTKPKKHKSRRRSRKEQGELDEDLQDLQTSEVEEETRGRTRGGIVNKQRDRNREYLELLKRRRAGERIPRVVDSDEEDTFDFDQDDGVDIDEIHTSANQWPIADNDYRSSTEGEDDGAENRDTAIEADEDNFVVDDEDDFQPSRNRHGLSGIPLEFTSFASSKPKELFVHVVEWLVKNKIAPAFSRNDELYTLSWNKVNDQIKAQAGSRLISSAWNADFKNAILARPEMQVDYIADGDDEAYLDCDACNKTNHPARYEFKFGGHPYHPDTLEPINEDEDESDEGGEEDNEKASYDMAGHLLPSSNTVFLLGSFCAANAEMGHKLTHWKFHLNQALLAYLEEEGVLSAEAILAREKKSKKKREKEAEDMVDMMQETGVIGEMWRGLQDDLEDARFGMEDHVARRGRNKARIGKVRVSRMNGRTEEWSEGGRMKLVVPSDSEGE